MFKKIISCMEYRGFTLAEVLITLAIIGVVAALTIPTVVRNYQKTQYVKQFQKAYSVLNSALSLAQAENGMLDTWNYRPELSAQTHEAFAKEYLMPYIKTVKECAGRPDEGCFAKGVNYKKVGGKENYPSVHDNSIGYKVVTADGMSLMIKFQQNCVENKKICMIFDVDVNGPQKGPNQYGRDLFAFVARPFTNNLVPYSSQVYNAETRKWEQEVAKIYTNCDSSSAQDGTYCGARIILDGFKMEY